MKLNQRIAALTRHEKTDELVGAALTALFTFGVGIVMGFAIHGTPGQQAAVTKAHEMRAVFARGEAQGTRNTLCRQDEFFKADTDASPAANGDVFPVSYCVPVKGSTQNVDIKFTSGFWARPTVTLHK